MINNVTCLACGAAIEISGGQDQIRCEYCGTELRIDEVQGESRLNLSPQPELQQDGLAEWTDRLTTDDVDRAPFGEPVTPALAGSDEAPSPDRAPETPFMVGELHEKPVDQASYLPVSESGSGTARRWWIAVVVALVVLLCILCACIVGSVVLAGSLFAY